MVHDKISFTREYCLCRRIPYKIRNESLVIDNHTVLFSLYNHSYKGIMDIIDRSCNYDKVTGLYSSFNSHFFSKYDVRELEQFAEKERGKYAK